MADNKNIGVITEQGYVAGNGLGFNPLKKKEVKSLEDKKEKEKDNKKK